MKEYTVGNRQSSIIGAGKTGHLHVEEWHQKTQKNHILNRDSKQIKDLNVRPNTIKLFQENISKTFFDINYSNSFFDPTPRVTQIKINKLDLNNLKSYSQGNNKQEEKTTLKWKKILAMKQLAKD